MPDDVHVRSGSRPHLSTMSPIQRYSPGGNIVSPQGTSRFATVMRSVFVGGLPLGINEQQLRAAFGSFGLINNIDIMRKPSSAYRKSRIDSSTCLYLIGTFERPERDLKSFV